MLVSIPQLSIPCLLINPLTRPATRPTRISTVHSRSRPPASFLCFHHFVLGFSDSSIQHHHFRIILESSLLFITILFHSRKPVILILSLLPQIFNKCAFLSNSSFRIAQSIRQVQNIHLHLLHSSSPTAYDAFGACISMNSRIRRASVHSTVKSHLRILKYYIMTQPFP